MEEMEGIVFFPPWIQLEKKFWNFKRQREMENFERQGRNFLRGNQILPNQSREELIKVTQK